MKLRKLRKLAQAKLGWPNTVSGREPFAKFDPFTGEQYNKRGSIRFRISTWNKAWKGYAAK